MRLPLSLKSKRRQSFSPDCNQRRAFSIAKCLGLGFGLAAILLPKDNVCADTTWTGVVSNDWGTAGNWDNGVPLDPSNNGAAIINLATGNFPVYSAATGSTVTDYDMFVGRNTGNSGRVNQTGGTLQVGNGNWLFVGNDGGTGTYNVTGSGNLSSGAINVGAWSAPGSTGTMTVSTSGTLNATGGTNRGGSFPDASVLVGENGSNGTLNL